MNETTVTTTLPVSPREMATLEHTKPGDIIHGAYGWSGEVVSIDRENNTIEVKGDPFGSKATE